MRSVIFVYLGSKPKNYTTNFFPNCSFYSSLQFSFGTFLEQTIFGKSYDQDVADTLVT